MRDTRDKMRRKRSSGARRAAGPGTGRGARPPRRATGADGSVGAGASRRRARGAKDAGRAVRGPLRRLRLPRWLLPLVVLGAVGFLYVRPITTYLETRDQLDERRSEVAGLRAERARVTARLERATSLEELARAARRIGYVRPEEHLFIVKGTAAWARRHAG